MVNNTDGLKNGLFGGVCLLATILAGLATGTWASQALHRETPTNFPELEMWRMALDAPLPPYPEEAIKQHQSGLVVMNVQFGTDGTVQDISVVEGRSPELDRAARRALSRWKFLPTDSTGIGKISIYFKIEKGRPVVAVPGRDRLVELSQPSEKADQQSPPAAQQEKEKPRVSSPSGWELPEIVRIVDRAEFDARRKDRAVTVLDVRSATAAKRDPIPGAVHIPSKDLSERAPQALKAGSTVLLDCSRNPAESCLLVTWTLAKVGVKEIWVLPFSKEK
jgi:TonB family protein